MALSEVTMFDSIRRIKVMNEPTPNEGDCEDAAAPRQEESSKAQSLENKVQIGDLLDFSFVEVAVERRVGLNIRSSLACS